MNNNLGLCHLVENQIRVGRRRHPADGEVARAAADKGMVLQKVYDGVNASLTRCAFRGEWAVM
jgi:hypothetical protein